MGFLKNIIAELKAKNSKVLENSKNHSFLGKIRAVRNAKQQDKVSSFIKISSRLKKG